MHVLRVLLASLGMSLVALQVLAAPINVNTADAEALAEALNGVGPRIASAIVEYREDKGPFSSIEELIEVKGIGPKTLEKNRENIVLDDAAEATAD